MPPSITKEEFDLFRSYIEAQCGIYLGEEKAYLVEHRLQRILKKAGCPSYRDLLFLTRREPAGGRLQSSIIDAITTNETSWFRDPKQFDVLREFLLPHLSGEIAQGRRQTISLWSAACSTGQEAYNLAMTVADFSRALPRDRAIPECTTILATDISTSSLSLAREGWYDAVSIKRGLTEAQRRRYFHPDGQGWRIKDDLKRMIKFTPFNLKHSFTGLGRFDVIFLRNVIIYFSDELKRQIFQRTADCLTPNGCLFLGTGETVSGYSDRFELEQYGPAFFYRVRK